MQTWCIAGVLMEYLRLSSPLIYSHPIFGCRFSSVYYEPTKTESDRSSKAESISDSKSLMDINFIRVSPTGSVRSTQPLTYNENLRITS